MYICMYIYICIYVYVCLCMTCVGVYYVCTSDVNDAEIFMPSRDFHFR